MSHNTRKHTDRARPGVTNEYRAYFAIIFLVALPVATVLWFRDLLRGNFAALHHGIVGRALSEASVTTPKVFSV